MDLWVQILLGIGVIILLIMLVSLAIEFLYALAKYFLTKELDLPKRYGPRSWVIITGPSSGQGKEFALNFAQRGFNLVLLGSLRTQQVLDEIHQKYPTVQVKFLPVNFGKAFEEGFFEEIERTLKDIPQGDISVLVNNVGHRTGWIGYENMPPEYIKETIAAGTLVQARLTQIVLPYLLKRPQRSALINITAQCLHPNLHCGFPLSNEISVPYLSVYEASNAFGFYHANSLYHEYHNRLDILNITPGAVVTENTPYLAHTLFQIDSPHFVQNILALLGNIQGTTCAHWGHALSAYLINLVPWQKESLLRKTGHTIARDFMNHHRDKSYEICPAP